MASISVICSRIAVEIADLCVWIACNKVIIDIRERIDLRFRDQLFGVLYHLVCIRNADGSIRLRAIRFDFCHN